jgi:hypothetical protein
VTECAKAEDTAQSPDAHVSYSALNDYEGCGKFFQLKRLIGLPEKPAWWHHGGRAVHGATESHDRQLYAAIGV